MSSEDPEYRHDKEQEYHHVKQSGNTLEKRVNQHFHLLDLVDGSERP